MAPAPSFISGALFAASWFVFLDAVLYSNNAADEPNPTFVSWVPGLLATVALAVVNLTSASSFAENTQGTMSSLMLASGWALALVSSAVALIMAAVHDMSVPAAGELASSRLGVAAVLQTSGLALASVAHWASSAPPPHLVD
jgi:hypothetical protein